MSVTMHFYPERRLPDRTWATAFGAPVQRAWDADTVYLLSGRWQGPMDDPGPPYTSLFRLGGGRGVPGDLSPYVARRYFEVWEGAAYNESWATLAELAQAVCVSVLQISFRVYLERDLLPWAASEGLSTKDVRCVFWFDE